MNIQLAIGQFLEYLEVVRRRSPATIEAYRTDLQGFVVVLDRRGDTPVQSVTVADVNRWLCSMQPNATSTVHRRLSALSSFFQTGLVLGYTATNPVERIERPPLNKKVMPAMSDKDIAKLLSVADHPMEQAIILTFATTGVRRAELIGIRIEDVDWQGQRIRIRGKGGKERQVIISPQLQRALWVYLHDKNLSDQSPLFPSRTGRQFHNSTLQRWFKRWLEQAAVEGKGFTIHSLPLCGYKVAAARAERS